MTRLQGPLVVHPVPGILVPLRKAVLHLHLQEAHLQDFQKLHLNRQGRHQHILLEPKAEPKEPPAAEPVSKQGAELQSPLAELQISRPKQLCMEFYIHLTRNP